MNKISEIVKIQMPIATNSESPDALLYNKDQSIVITVAAETFTDKMDGALKKFFEYELDEEGILTVLDEVEEQHW